MYLGIEIGGTKLQLGLGLGDGNGALAALWRGTVEPAKGADGIRAQILAAIPELLGKAGSKRKHILGVGIGFGGPVDDATRTVIKSHQIAGWDNFPLADWIHDLLDIPAVLGNDADVAGLAEALFGAGRGLSPIFYITLGSGIGGGLIIQGEIYRGCGRGAAEIGHLRLPDWSQRHASNLNEDILETRASGWALARLAEHAMLSGQGGNSLLGHPVSASDIANAANQGDDFALALLNEAWLALARAIAQVVALLCPRRIVIGGGVSLMGEQLLFTPLRKMVADQVFKPFAHCYDIVPAALGEEVVVQGALALAKRRFGAQPV